MNTPVYIGYKTNEDPHVFADEVYKILFAMGINKKEKAELAAYQLNYVDQIWYKSVDMDELI